MPSRSTLLHLTAAAMLFATVQADAATSNVSPSGFLLTHKVEVRTDPATAFEALGQPAKWWNPQHTYSSTSANLTMDLRGGGCFCETWARNSVEHARVVYVSRDRQLRLDGALGPLQSMAVNAILEFTLVQHGLRTTVTMTYRVRGSNDAGLDKIAASVDKVMGDQLQRFAAFLEAPAAGSAASATSLDKTFDSDGTTIRYVEDGRGDVVVLLHDLGLNAEEQWIRTGILPLLAQKHRVVVPDLRGHGKSGKPANYGTEMARDVIRLLDHLGVKRAHLVGYGMGAQVAGYLAATQPERLITLVLSGAVPVISGSPDEDQRMENLVRLAASKPASEASLYATIARSTRELAITNAQLVAIRMPTLGLVGNDDPNVRHFSLIKGMMPAMVRLVSVAEADHATAPREGPFGVAIQYFLGYHPAVLVK